MGWVFKSTTQEPLPGIGPGPLTDEEFDAAITRMWPGEEDAVRKGGLYEHVKDKPETKAGGGDE